MSAALYSPARRADYPQPGDTVIICEGTGIFAPLRLQRGASFSNRRGTFRHDDMLTAPYGSLVNAHSRNGGYVYVLAFTPELWTLALPHRTQILFSVDIAQVVAHLSLRPGSVVVESGTGSGSLTASLARAVAPTGHVYTFEFNADRAGKAVDEFASLGLAPIVTVTHADACSDGFGAAGVGVADGVFLDLPQPWLALPHARRALRRCGVVCSFSPCIEQVQRTATAMRALGFDDVRTIESLLRPFDALPYIMEQPKVDWRGDGATGSAAGAGTRGAKRARIYGETTTGASAEAAPPPTAAASLALDGADGACGNGGAGAVRPAAGGDDGAEGAGEEEEEEEQEEEDGLGSAANSSAAVVVAAPPAATAADAPPSTADAPSGAAARIRPFTPYPQTLESRAVGCRPGAAMRGHTGFLTFGTLYRPPVEESAVTKK